MCNQNQICIYTEEKLDSLRKRIREDRLISDWRLSHTLGVETECASLASVFGLGKNDSLRLCAAGLLHDITKERILPEQIELCDRFGIEYPSEAIHSPKVFHGWTAASLMRELYPEYCDSLMCDAVFAHTTGKADMTLFESLLFLADYIEPGRRFEDCIKLRNYFYEQTEKISPSDPLRHKKLNAVLIDTLIMAFDFTISSLLADGEEIFPVTVRARNSLVRGRNAAKPIE